MYLRASLSTQSKLLTESIISRASNRMGKGRKTHHRIIKVEKGYLFQPQFILPCPLTTSLSAHLHGSGTLPLMVTPHLPRQLLKKLTLHKGISDALKKAQVFRTIKEVFVLKTWDQQTQGHAQSQSCAQPSLWGPTHLRPGPLRTAPPAAASSAAAFSPGRPSCCSSMCLGCQAPAHTCLSVQLQLKTA